MSQSAFSTLVVAVPAVSAIISLAMLFLILWLAPRQRENQLMALYLATVITWAAGGLASYVSAFRNAFRSKFPHAAGERV